MPTGRLAIVIAVLVTLLVAGCSSSGTKITDDGQGSVPEAAGDVLTIISPADGITVNRGAITVEGTAPDGADVVRDVSFGGDDHTTASGGRWSMDVELDEGENQMTFRVGDDKTTATTLLVIYAPSEAEATPAEPSPASESSPKPTAKPKPTEAAQATEEQEPKPLSVKVTKRTSSVLRNQTASVTSRRRRRHAARSTSRTSPGPRRPVALARRRRMAAVPSPGNGRSAATRPRGSGRGTITCELGDRYGDVETAVRVR